MGCICSKPKVAPAPEDVHTEPELSMVAPHVDWDHFDLTPDERKRLIKRVKEDNKFNDTSMFCQAWIELTQHFVYPRPTPPTSSIKWDAIAAPRVITTDHDTIKGPGGLKIVKDDEDEPAVGALFAFGQALLLGSLKDLSWGEELDAESVAEGKSKLKYFDSVAEGVATMKASFGDVLPIQFQDWPDLSTDEAMAELCFVGCGAWKLRGVRSAEECGHPVPEGAIFECSVEDAAKYEVRPEWVRYGATAYFGALPQPGGADGSFYPGRLLGVWVCHSGTLVGPEDEMPTWEHAKMVFRSTLGMEMTVKDHLLQLHFIVANGLMIAARETLGANHPLRRLVKPHYYRTAAINYAAVPVLVEQNSLAHRTFGFTGDAWTAYLTDLFNQWKWTPVDELLTNRNLPQEVLDTWPIAVDGLEVRGVMLRHVDRVLSLFYPTEEALLGDEQIQCFYKHFATQIDVPWGLPPLSKATLVSLVADLIWWVSAGHEYVGAIVEYLTSPTGLVGKIAPGERQCDVETFAMQLCIISQTGFTQPKLVNDWIHLWNHDDLGPEQHAKVVEALNTFQAELVATADKIDVRNDARMKATGRAFVAFNPKLVESSVSI